VNTAIIPSLDYDRTQPPELVAERTLEELKTSLGTAYNLWSALAEFSEWVSSAGITTDNIIEDGRYVMILQHQLIDDWTAAFARHIIMKVFQESSLLDVVVLSKPQQLRIQVQMSHKNLTTPSRHNAFVHA
jgi:hypothetical protein